jgi:hypothetical protein
MAFKFKYPAILPKDTYCRSQGDLPMSLCHSMMSVEGISK